MARWLGIVGALVCLGCATKEEAKPPKTAMQEVAERLDAENEKDARAALDRMDEGADAKTVAIAVIDAATAHNLPLPSRSEFRPFVAKYLKPKELMAAERFEWTFEGGHQYDIRDITTTPLGHVGGAVAYADGSVRRREVGATR